VGEHDRLHTVAEVELLKDVRDVRLHGCLADVESFRDLAVRMTASDQSKDISFAVAELVELLRGLKIRKAGELLDDPFGDRRRQKRIAVGNRANCGNQLFGGVVFQDEPARARS
jgi:hypothetical protein